MVVLNLGEGHTNAVELTGEEHKLVFTNSDLQSRYSDLKPNGRVDLIVIGCPQASLEEIRITASG